MLYLPAAYQLNVILVEQPHSLPINCPVRIGEVEFSCPLVIPGFYPTAAQPMDYLSAEVSFIF